MFVSVCLVVNGVYTCVLVRIHANVLYVTATYEVIQAVPWWYLLPPSSSYHAPIPSCPFTCLALPTSLSLFSPPALPPSFSLSLSLPLRMFVPFICAHAEYRKTNCICMKLIGQSTQWTKHNGYVYVESSNIINLTLLYRLEPIRDFLRQLQTYRSAAWTVYG